jgi:hypothetical protein
VRAQERDEVGGGTERVGDGGAVSQGQGGAQLAVHLGHQERLGRHDGAIERRQADEPQMVVGVSRADRDLGEERVHVTMVARP